MGTSDFVKILFIGDCIKSSIQPTGYENGTLTLTFKQENVELTKADLIKKEIPYESYASNEISIVLNKVTDQTKIFFDEKEYQQKIHLFFNPIEDSFQPPSIALLNYNNGVLFLDDVSKNIFLNDKIFPTFFFDNTLWYYQTLQTLKSEKFADYINTLKDEIIIYTATKGIKHIGYSNILPAFDPARSIKSTCEKLIKRVNNSDDFIIHFKNELFNIKIEEDLLSVKRIIESLPQVMMEAENSLELYLKNFSFDKLKSDLQKEKEKYFTTLREILGKIISQILATPISFAASVFATYKVDSDITLIIILGSFFIYTLFTIYIQYIYLNDVGEVQDEFSNNFTSIVEKSGLPITNIEEESKKIRRRITDIKNVIICFRYLLVILFMAFAYFIFTQLSSRNTKNKESKAVTNIYLNFDTFNSNAKRISIDTSKPIKDGNKKSSK